MNIVIALSTTADLEYPTMGSERQAVGMGNALARRGHQVKIVNLLRTVPDWDRTDLLHLVNAGGPKGPYMLAAQIAARQGIPIFCSPVYWPVEELEKELTAFYGFDAAAEKRNSQQFDEFVLGAAVFWAMSDFLLPNAEGEMTEALKLMRKQHIEPMKVDARSWGERYAVIPNAVDLDGEIMPALADRTDLPDRLEDVIAERFVLCAARIEVRKNQHRLVEAMEILWRDDPELQLVLIGQMSEPYVKKFKEKLDGRNIVIGTPGTARSLFKVMRRASAHCLPSLLETPGLVSLEAAALGVPVVVSDRGTVKEYLPEGMGGVFYCDPLSPESIAEALRAAVRCESTDEVARHVRTSFNYDRVGELLDAAYQGVLRR